MWCFSVQWSNQPFQNSQHISGPSGWNSRSLSNCSPAREPKLAVLCMPGSVPPVSMKSVAPSEVNSGTSMPRLRMPSARAVR